VDPCHMLHAMWCWDYSRQVNIRMENTKRKLNSLLQSMKSSDMSSFIASCTRCGLVNPSGN
jgi:hypothetical protein